ncbi:MAG: PA14 domain-containing protein [Limisphaerales bacterium]
MRGYLLPPQSGNYTFWIAANSEAQLWISPNDQPSARVRVATSPASGVAFRQWNGNVSQRSASIPLVAGQRYYFEILHQSPLRDAAGAYHVSMQWQMPDGTIESPVPAYRVQPPGTPPSPLQVVISDPPDFGTLTVTNGKFAYTPKPIISVRMISFTT